jgi:hypothetical protein
MNVWFTEESGSRIGRLTVPLLGGGITIDEFPTPTSDSNPEGITAGPDGYLWFTELFAKQIGRLNPASGTVDEFPIPTATSEPEGITVGPDGNLWFTELIPNRIGEITTAGFFVAEFTIPSNKRGFGITTGPHSTLAFTEPDGNKIGVVHDMLDANHAFVQALYHDALGRSANSAELDFWVSALVQSGSAAVVNGIEHSPEGRTHLVRGWYLQFLGRAALNGEEQGFVQLLVNGSTEEQVLSFILGSSEYFNHAPLVPGVGGGSATNQTFVKALYLQLLNRPAGDNEVSAWVSAIPSMGRGGVALIILGTAEHRSVVVGTYYTLLLHRDTPPARDVAGWINSSLDLGRIRLTFESTLEFFVHG